MKIEMDDVKPENFVDRWPGEFRVFSHFEMALGIPHVLLLGGGEPHPYEDYLMRRSIHENRNGRCKTRTFL